LSLTLSRFFLDVKKAVLSTATDKKLILYLLLLLALHILGVLFLYDIVTEFDIVPHFWFGYVLSEWSSKAAEAVNLQPRLATKLQNHSWKNASVRKADFVLRLTGFLLIGGFFWEGMELVFSGYFGFQPDPFFAFPITLSNMDGAVDVLVGIVGVAAAFVIEPFESQVQERKFS